MYCVFFDEIGNTVDETATVTLEPIHHRSSHRRCSIEKGALRNFAKFTGKRLCQSLFFNKVAGLGPEPESTFEISLRDKI